LRTGQKTDYAEKGEFTMKSPISILGTLALCLHLTAAAQLSNPQGLAFDSAGHLWVANGGANNVVELNVANGTVLNTITNGVNGPTRLFFVGSDLYVVNTNGNTLTEYGNRIQTGWTLVNTISIPPSVNKCLGAAVDAYGDVYLAGNQSDNVVVLRPGREVVENLTQDTSGFPFTAPGTLVINGQNIYAGFGSGDSEDAVISYNVGELLSGDAQEITVYNDNLNTGPTGVAFDVEGNVYISEFYSGTAVKYAPGGGTPLMVISENVNGPEGIAVAKNGYIYVSNSGSNNISVYKSNGEPSSPATMD
jgi:serine/threonine protein kinase, bacterial